MSTEESRPVSANSRTATRAAAALDELKSARFPKPGPAELATAMAGLRQFLQQPPESQTPSLLLLAATYFGRAHLEGGPSASPVVVFEIDDEKGGRWEVRCNLSAYALLLLIQVLGQSVFINSNGVRPFLKVFGRAGEKAGFVFARLLLGAEADELVRYRNGNQLDLTYSNLVLASGPAKRGTVEWYGQALGYAAGLPDSLLAGAPEQKFTAAQDLLRRAMELVETDRGEAGEA